MCNIFRTLVIVVNYFWKTPHLRMLDRVLNMPAIRQKGESPNGCYKKTKPVKFSEKQTFLTL